MNVVLRLILMVRLRLLVTLNINQILIWMFLLGMHLSMNLVLVWILLIL